MYNMGLTTQILASDTSRFITTTSTQGVIFTPNDTRPCVVTVPASYNGTQNPSSVNGFELTFTQPNLWTRSMLNFNTFNLTTQVVTNLSSSSGSLDITFLDFSNNPIEEFVDIPGHLDTFKLNNGLYADPGVEGIFIQLKKYLYPESIFNIILNSLSEFFTSEGFKQGVTESIEYLNKEFLEGKITIDQFNELVTKSEEELAGQYGDNYMKNYNAVKAAINKYRYLLKN